MSDTLLDPRIKGEIVRATQEVRKAKEALTVLYDRMAEKQEVSGRSVATLEQQVRSLEARMKRIDSQLTGDSVTPGLMTSVWANTRELKSLKKYLGEWRETPEEPPPLPTASSLPVPPAFVTVHSAWIYVVVPGLICLVVALATVIMWVMG